MVDEQDNQQNTDEVSADVCVVSWMDEETYRRIKKEVDAWPEWKKAAYRQLGEW